MKNKREVLPLTENNFEIINEHKTITNKIKNLYKGWKKFAFKDDILNIAIGMILATSFKNVVNSMVVDILMPVIIGLGVGTNTNNLFVILVNGPSNITYITLESAKKDGAVTLNYGIFINIFTDLIFVTLFLYMILKIISKLSKKIDE